MTLHSRRSTTLDSSLSLPLLNLRLQVCHDRALLAAIAISRRRNVEFLPQRAKTRGLGAERSGGGWAGRKELEDQRQQTTVLQNNAEFFFQAGLTDEAALNSACSEASTTSSWMPTPHTFCLEPKAVHSMYVAALTFLPPFSPVALVVMACSL